MKFQEKKENPSAKKNMVYIVGSNQLLNDLLRWFLSQEIDIVCEIADYTPNIFNLITNDTQEKEILIIVDCMDIDIAQLWAGFSVGDQNRNPQHFIAFFNVNPEHGIERQAVDHGIRGIFYKNDPATMLSRGVVEILKGELWYSRKAMSEFLTQKKSTLKLTDETVSSLTFREREILIGIASGASNKDIAENLGISLHTVKTHIYNIYKKINVPNRLQAALWAAQYL